MLKEETRASTESALLQRFRAGDVRALGELIATHRHEVNGRLAGVCPLEALEAMSLDVWRCLARRARESDADRVHPLLEEALSTVMRRWRARLRWGYGVNVDVLPGVTVERLG